MKFKIYFIPVISFLSIMLGCKHSSEDQMLQLLNQQKQRFFNHENSFCPKARLAFYDSVTRGAEFWQQLEYNCIRATTNIELGNVSRAIDLLKESDKSPLLLEQRHLKRRVMKELALAYLRMAEQSNCITNHSAESCVFPIQGKGVHKDRTGSLKAKEIYEALLKEDSTDMESRWLLNIACMTLGEYPAQVSPKYLLQELATDSIKVIPFDDIAADLNLDVKNIAGGSIAEDFDNDGYLDIVTSSMDLTEEMHYFKNNADGTFSDISEKSGLKKFTGGLNIMQTDYNNDGYKDIFVTRGGWQLEFGSQPNSLLRNNKDGTFTDVTIESGLLSFHPTQTATWNDFDNDGWLDVFIGNETSSIDFKSHPCELYINNQNGTFTEIARQAKCDLTYYVKGVTSGDYDNDGWKDVFLSTMSGKRILLKNKGTVNGNVQFEDVTFRALPNDDKNNSFSTWFWDYDNDGWLDILAGDYTFQTSLGCYSALAILNRPTPCIGEPRLYHNNKNRTFTNVTKEMGLFRSAFAMGANFGDIDNDGYLDMYLGTGNPNFKSLVPNKMFKNIGGKRFADVTTSARVGNLQKGHGVAFADMDNDGDEDIYIEMGGAFTGDAYQNSFYLNPGQSDNNWIKISLEGTTSNKSAIGSRIKLTFKEDGKQRSVYRDVNSGGSFGSSPLRREIGLSTSKVIDEIEIKWHGSGARQSFKNVAVNQFIKITEGSNKIEKIKFKELLFKKSAHKHHHMAMN